MIASTLYHRFVEACEDYAIFTTDPGGVVTHWNKGAERVTGFRSETLTGQSWESVFTPADIRDGVLAREVQAAVENGRVEFRRWLLRADGTRFWAVGAVVALHGLEGALAGFGVSFHDDTVSKEREEMILHRGIALWDADDRQTAFLGRLAHELRNQLSPIVNLAGVLKARAAEADLQRFGEQIDRHARRMLGLIEELFDADRVYRGKIRLARRRVDSRELVTRAIETAQPVIDGRGHQLAVSLPPYPVWLEADPNRLNQVLVNLLTNAAKYTPQEGRIEVALAREAGEVVFRVKDNGVGIPPDQLESVFELYSQVSPDSGRGQGGLGIGLAVVREIVALHGGTVAAPSEGEGLGSEFVVRLPAAPPPRRFRAAGVRRITQRTSPLGLSTTGGMRQLTRTRRRG